MGGLLSDINIYDIYVKSLLTATLFLITPSHVRLFLMKCEDIREEIPKKQQLMMRAKQELLQRLPSAKDLVDIQYTDSVLSLLYLKRFQIQ